MEVLKAFLLLTSVVLVFTLLKVVIFKHERKGNHVRK